VTSAAAAATTDDRTAFRGRNLVAGLLLGVGVAAFVDETVFHQLLHWHHFYDRSTPAAGLVSDGLFHAFSFGCAVGALFLLADLWRRRAFDARTWWGGLLAAAGAFLGGVVLCLIAVMVVDLGSFLIAR